MGMALELSKLSPSNWFRRDTGALPVTDLREGAGSELVPVTRLMREMDRAFDDFFRGFGMTRFDPFVSRPLGESAGDFLRPQLDIVEGKDGYTVSLEVPGVERDDLQVSVSENALVLTGQKKRESRSDGEQAFHVERSFGSFRRVLELPADADLDKISARYKNGVLTVKVPRKPGATPSGGRKIEIAAE